VKTEILTSRLRLVALTLDQLQLCLEEPARLGPELGVSISLEFMDDPARRATGFKVNKMSKLASQTHPWYTFWLIVLIANCHGVGLAGFKGDPNERGEVEIGYGIAPAYRNQGYSTEAVKALTAWAFQDPVCKTILADTLKDNAASNRVLAKVGMQVYHETDEGLCWKIERRSGLLL
jgi:RimJ/RimL family protein N-acetyltransferase